VRASKTQRNLGSAARRPEPLPGPGCPFAVTPAPLPRARGPRAGCECLASGLLVRGGGRPGRGLLGAVHTGVASAVWTTRSGAGTGRWPGRSAGRPPGLPRPERIACAGQGDGDRQHLGKRGVCAGARAEEGDRLAMSGAAAAGSRPTRRRARRRAHASSALCQSLTANPWSRVPATRHARAGPRPTRLRNDSPREQASPGSTLCPPPSKNRRVRGQGNRRRIRTGSRPAPQVTPVSDDPKRRQLPARRWNAG
jgi:hypothetical protein